MRKYLYIYKSEIMSNLQYVFDILVGFIGYAVHIFIFLNLWKYIYSDPNELINGYSMNQMIWYVIVTEILWSALNGRKFNRRISTDVRTGNISYNINKPYDYVEYMASSHLGITTLKFILVTILGMILGILFLGSFPKLTLLSIICVLISCFLSLVISIFIIIGLGLFAFYIEDATPFYWLYSKLILILGTLFPIEFFPTIIQPIIKYSPIFAVSIAPAKLFVDFSLNTFLNTIIIQGIYLLVSVILVHLFYKKGVKKLNVNGG